MTNNNIKTYMLRIAFSILPVAVAVLMFSAFNPIGVGNSNESKSELQIVMTPQFEYGFDNKPKYEDSSKQYIHMVWWNTKDIKITKFVVERSINHGPFIAISTIDYDKSTMKDVMLTEMRDMPDAERFNKVLYTTEKWGMDGFIYNEIFENEDYFNSDIRYRIRAELPDNQVNFSDVMGNIKSNPGKFNHDKAKWLTSINQVFNPAQNYFPISSDTNVAPLNSAVLRAACPSVNGSVPSSTCAKATSTLTCDCCGTYSQTVYDDPCTASPPDNYKVTGCTVNCDTGFIYPGCSGNISGSNCVCACDCQFDDCCQHNCVDYATCGCYPWKPCQTWNQNVSVINSVTPGALTVTGTVATSCPTSSDINVSVTTSCGKTSSITYSWSNKATSQDLANVPAGTYTVTVTESGASPTCVQTASFTVTCLLPVSLTHFGAEKKGNTIEISWITTSEKDNDYFTVERSHDAANFSDLKVVDGAGNSTNTNHYSIIDSDPLLGTSYYRLRATDFNGNADYSSIVPVILQQNDLFTVTPNPTKGKVEMIFYAGDEEVEIKILDYTGKNILQKNLTLVTGMYKMDADLTEYASGVYFVSFSTKRGSLIRKLLKN